MMPDSHLQCKEIRLPINVIRNIILHSNHKVAGSFKKTKQTPTHQVGQQSDFCTLNPEMRPYIYTRTQTQKKTPLRNCSQQLSLQKF